MLIFMKLFHGESFAKNLIGNCYR